MPTDWPAARERFPVLREWTYLNAATFGPLPDCAVRAMNRHFERRDHAASLDFLEWFDDVDRVRALCARFVGAEADDVAFIPSAGVGLSWLLQGLDWAVGDRVLTLDQEFPNNHYAPEFLRSRGVEVDRAPADLEFTADGVLSRLTPRTKLVLLSFVNYSSGLLAPLETIGRACREAGAIFCVDGTQGVGALPLDMRAAAADALIVHGYKWMMCPAGAGFFCARPRLRERLRPSVVSWRSHKSWREVDSLHHGTPELPDEAAKYEGGVLNFAGIAALGAVLDMLFELGVEAVFERVAENAERTREVLRAAGGAPACDLSPHFDSPVVAAAFPGVDVSRLALDLRELKIAVAARKGRLRVSPHFYNDESDFEALAAALDRTLPCRTTTPCW